MSHPLAYFVTFHTYGTWLHGATKGSVDLDHNQYGREFVAPDSKREHLSLDAMTQPPYVMQSAVERQVVCDAMIALCREKGWLLLAVHVRANHVHLVFHADRDPGRAMSDLKACASRALTKAGFDDVHRKRWSRHGSTLHLWTKASVAEKVDYTLNQQGARMAYYDGTAGAS